jgi:hypothetical protein
MGMRQMTFDIPEEVAEQFSREVPETEQSSVVTKLLLRHRPTPKLTEAEWDAVCGAVNADPDIAELENDMDALSGERR